MNLRPAFLVLALFLAAESATAQDPGPPDPGAPPDSTGPGWGMSYWGPIPPPADSVSAVYDNLPMPVWEGALVWPFRVITFPVKLVGMGIGSGVDALGKGSLYPKISQWLSGREVPVGVAPVVSASSLSGLGLGLTFFHNHFPGRSTRVRLTLKASTRGSRRASLGLTGSGPVLWELGAGHRLKPNARFFGIGPHSREEDLSFFTLEQNWVGGSLTLGVVENTGMTVDAVYLAVGAREPGSDFHPSTSTLYPGVPGFNETVQGLSLSGAITRDSVPRTSRPESGGVQRLKIARFIATDGRDVGFWTYRAELHQYLPLWFTGRALAFRGFMSWMKPAPRKGIPFHYMLTNDDPDLMRGYRDFRWRDQGMLVGNLEYRWPIWAPVDPRGFGVDAYVFTDVGQVFGDSGEIAMRNLTLSLGAGLRTVSTRDLIALLEFGWSNEDYQFRLSASQVFETGKERLFRGKNAVPVR